MLGRGVAVVAAAAVWLSASPSRAESELFALDLPAQELARSLQALSDITGRNLLFSPADVRGVTGNRVAGEMDVSAALTRLLDGSELEARLSVENVIVIARIAPSEDDEALRESVTMASRQRGFLSGVAAGAIGLVMGQGAAGQEAEGDAAEAREPDILIVTGIRGQPRSVLDSPTPIDVFTAEQLERQPQIGVFESLRFLTPSVNLPQRAGGGTATFIASAGLRGLNPDQTLVLVNGKRRHKTSLINTSTGLYSGSAGVDLNLIPNSAIGRIEVLRDGAAAQYGSDAIAGVINIILKEDAEGVEASGVYGQNFDRGDGEYYRFSGSAGFELGEEGFATLFVEYADEEFSNRARPVPLPDPDNPAGLNLYPLLEDGGLDPREEIIDRLVTSNFGNFPQTTWNAGVNAGYDLGPAELYGFATYSNRDSTLDFTFRRPRDSRNIPEI
ncbi:MAG: TonB-dependent receptor, partial [Caulobacterales bacterium]|nr:TonB-dependent receptor [Caulobacterales bacterium]